MRIAISNFRAIEDAVLEGDGIILVAGENEAGKTSLLKPVQAALTGNMLVDGRLKKDIGAIIRDGADKATVVIEGPEGRVMASWPDCQVNAGGKAPRASTFAAGLENLADLKPEARSAILAQYFELTPTEEDLKGEITNEKIRAAVWGQVQKRGWDDAAKWAAEQAKELKGSWRQVTKELWGSAKAEGWHPDSPHWTFDLPDAQEGQLLIEAENAQMWFEQALGQQAVSADAMDRLQKIADELPVRQRLVEEAKQKAQEAADAFVEAERHRRGLPPIVMADRFTCKNCGAVHELVMINQAVREWQLSTEPLDEVTMKDRQLAISAADGQMANRRDAKNLAEHAIETAQAAVHEAERAVRDLDAARRKSVDAETVAAKRADAEKAKGRLEAFRTYQEARRLHRQIAGYLNVADLLGPDGLRRLKVMAALKGINATLAGLCDAVGWGPVAINPDLEITIRDESGVDRLFFDASASMQFRARVVLTIMMAQVDQSSMLVIDEAGVVVGDRRNAFFQLLRHVGMPTLVAVSYPKLDPARTPNLERVGWGRTYWAARGQPVRPLADILAEAA